MDSERIPRGLVTGKTKYLMSEVDGYENIIYSEK